MREQIITTFLLQMGNRLVKERGCVGGVGQQVTLQVQYDSLSDVGEIRVYQRADFQSGSRVLKKVF